MTPSSLCFGSRRNTPGIFSVSTTGHVITFKLTYLSGYVACISSYKTNWGCRYGSLAGTGKYIGTYITNSAKQRLLPGNTGLFNEGGCYKGLYYSLPWANPDSRILLFDNFSTPLFVTFAQQFQVWYAEDLLDCTEDDNSGQTCVKVHGLFV